MFGKIFSKLASVLVLCIGVSQMAAADPFFVTWNSTLGVSAGPYNAGDAMSVTMVLDNGGTDAISQVWSAADLVSVTYTLNNGAITTVFGSTGLNLTTGNFVTDASGVLVSVPSAWGNFTAGIPVLSTDDPLGSTDVRWVINGINFVYSNYTPGVSTPARSSDAPSNITPAAWTNPVAVGSALPPASGDPNAIPTLSTYGLILTVLGLLMVARRRFLA